MVLTWVPSAALRMASCKRPTPNPPKPGYCRQPVPPLPLPIPMSPRLTLMPHLTPEQVLCPLSFKSSLGRKLCFLVSMAAVGEEPFAVSLRFLFFLLQFVPLPPFDPSPFKPGRKGIGGRNEERKLMPLHPVFVFFLLFFCFFTGFRKYFTFLLLLNTQSSCPEPNTSYYYEMNKYLIFFLTQQNRR